MLIFCQFIVAFVVLEPQEYGVDPGLVADVFPIIVKFCVFKVDYVMLLTINEEISFVSVQFTLIVTFVNDTTDELLTQPNNNEHPLYVEICVPVTEQFVKEEFPAECIEIPTKPPQYVKFAITVTYQ